MFPGFEAFIDATEQEIQRPKNKRKRKTLSITVVNVVCSSGATLQ